MQYSVQELRKKALEKRLKDAFKDDWFNLSESQKKKVIDNFYKKLYLDRITTKETLRRIENKGISSGLAFLA